MPPLMQAGQVLEVPIAINTSATPLRAVDVEISLDESVLRVVSCFASSGIASLAGFECRYNIFGHLDSVQLSYVEEASSTSLLSEAGLIEVATLRLEVRICMLLRMKLAKAMV